MMTAEEFDISALIEAPFTIKSKSAKTANNNHSKHQSRDYNNREIKTEREPPSQRRRGRTNHTTDDDADGYDEDRMKRSRRSGSQGHDGEKSKSRRYPSRSGSPPSLNRHGAPCGHGKVRSYDSSSRRRHRDHYRSRSRSKSARSTEYSRSRSRERGEEYPSAESFTRKHSGGRDPRAAPPPPPPTQMIFLTEAQRDRRTVFCRQLSMRLENRQLKSFFIDNGCPVRDARIVTDKYSRRSKGVAYVEFFEEETVAKAIKLGGKKLLSVPIIIELTETEKNRQAQEISGKSAANNKLAGNEDDLDTLMVSVARVEGIHPSIDDQDLTRLFKPFGDIKGISLNRADEDSDSCATIAFRRNEDAKDAADNMNDFLLAGRHIRVTCTRVRPSELPSSTSLYKEEDASLFMDDAEIIGSADDEAHTSAEARAELFLQASKEASKRTRCLHLAQMYNPLQESQPDWHLEIATQAREELQKFGTIQHLDVPKTADGDVFVLFADGRGVSEAIKALDGRWFGGMQIKAMCADPSDYQERYPETKKFL